MFIATVRKAAMTMQVDEDGVSIYQVDVCCRREEHGLCEKGGHDIHPHHLQGAHDTFAAGRGVIFFPCSAVQCQVSDRLGRRRG